MSETLIETLTLPSPTNGDGHKPGRRRPRERGLYKATGSRFWWYAIGYRGKMLRASTGKTDVKEAREVLQQKRREIAAAKGGYTTVIGPETRQVKIGALLDGLEQDLALRGARSLAQAKSHLKPVRDSFGDWKAVELTEGAIDRYVSARRTVEAASATVNRETQLLGQALRPFLERHRLPVPTIRRLPEDNAREGFFERAEIEALVSRLPEDLRDFCWWGFHTGWRKGEIASLRWADVDLEGRSLRLNWRKSKNKKVRHMALEGDLAAIIERRRAARTILEPDGTARVSELVFHRDGEPVQDFRKAWASACKAAGLSGRLFHDLRRTAIRNMTRAGVDETVAMKISGHRTRAVFDRYNITDDQDIRVALLKTQEYVRSLPAERAVIPLAQARSNKA